MPAAARGAAAVILLEPGICVPDHELEIRYVRSSGPGGQNVNKTNTKAVVRWNLRGAGGVPGDVKARFVARFGSRVTASGDIILTSDRYRDQPRNLDDCIAKLTAMLLEVARPPRRRRPTRPGSAARERRIGAKKIRGSLKSLRGRVESD